MVGTMYLAMAICTVHADFETCTSRIDIIVIQEISYMSAATAGRDICMALLAQLGTLLVQQSRMIRAVNPVT